MTSVVAALIALGAAVAVAALLYFKRSAESRWDLALLRLIWTALLVYAILAPPTTRETTATVAPSITLLLDSSASLNADPEPLAAEAVARLEALGYQVHLRSFDTEILPEQGEWVYLGDGHLPMLDVAAPKYLSLAPAKALEPQPLIQGIILPEVGLMGTTANYRILAPKAESVEVQFMKQRFRQNKGQIQLPRKTGNYTLTVYAQAQGYSDTLSTEIQVKGFLTKLYVVANAPHPHEGMVRRYAKRRGIAVETVDWKSISDTEFDGPIVAIGGADRALQALQRTTRVPLLALDAKPTQVYLEKAIVASLDGGKMEVVAQRGVKNLSYSEGRLDARNVHWYLSAQKSEKAQALFESFVATILDAFLPAQLRVSLPQRSSRGEAFDVVATVLNSREQIVSSTITSKIFLEDTLLSVVSYTNDAGVFTGRFLPVVSGQYVLKTEAQTSAGTLSQTSRIEVSSLDVERTRPLNSLLIANWREAGTQDLATAGEKVEKRSLTFEQKNPQHLRWWYWGLAFLAAGLEWFLRRRSGLI